MAEDRETLSKQTKPTKRFKAGWTDVALVCRKCSKKLDGGFGKAGAQRFAKALRGGVASHSPGESGKKARTRKAHVGIVEVDCLGLCPKGAVVTIRAGDPGEWLVVPEGTPIGDVMRDLGLVPDHTIHR